MAKEEGRKKIIGLRTFADDANRARGLSVSEEKKETVVPKTSTENTLETAVKKDLQNSGLDTPPSQSKTQKTEGVQEAKKPATPAPQKGPTAPIEVVNVDSPMDVPPFHHLRASGPEDTTFTNTKEAHLGAKKDTHKKSSTQKQIRPEALGIDTSGIEQMSDSVLSQSQKVTFDTENAEANMGEGTIVTDRRREKFRLIPAIGEAVLKWFDNKVEEIESSKKPKHEIIKSTRRKKIITAAAEDAKLAPDDDHSEVTERLRGVDRITETEEMKVKDETEVPKPTWTHTGISSNETQIPSDKIQQADRSQDESIEPDKKLEIHTDEKIPIHKTATNEQDTEQEVLPAGTDVSHSSGSPSEQPVVEKHTPRTLQENVAAPTSFEEQIPVSQADSSVAAEEAAPKIPASGFTDSAEAIQKTETSPENVTITGTPENRTPEETADLPTFSRAPVPTYRLNRSGQPIPHSETGTPYLTFASVMIVAAILGILTTAWWFTRNDDVSVVVIDQTPPLVSASTEVNIPLSTNRTELYNTLLNMRTEQGEQTVTYTPFVGGAEATLDQIFSTLSLRAPGDFIRNVSQVMFGFSEAQEPFIVLRTYSFDVAFGGILVWEQYMANDLAPLFGAPGSTNSYDSKIINHDIRVLTSDGYNDKIVYGFINKHTILITTTRDVFAQIAPHIIQ